MRCTAGTGREPSGRGTGAPMAWTDRLRTAVLPGHAAVLPGPHGRLGRAGRTGGRTRAAGRAAPRTGTPGGP